MRGLEAHGESPKSGALPMSPAPICRLSRVGAAPPHGTPARFSGRGAGGASHITARQISPHPLEREMCHTKITPLTVWFVGPPGAPPASRLAKLGALVGGVV